MNGGRRTARPLLVALAAVAVLGGAAAIAAGAVGGAGVSIVFRAYQPADLTVGLGQAVTWRNESFDQHTVTSATGLFSSGVMTKGGSFSVTFTKAGTFDYSCTIHPSMHGSVLVLPIAPGTVQLQLTTRHLAHGEAVVVHVLAARGGAGLLLQTPGRDGGWRTIARSHLDLAGRSMLSLKNPAHERLRVVVLAAGGAPRLVSQTVLAPG